MIHYRYMFQYRDQLIRNRERILQYLSEPVDEDLSRLLTRYGCSIGSKLLWLLEYFENYDMQLSIHEARGIEMACSLDFMVSRAGGSKQTWRRAILTLCALGLLRQYKPRRDARMGRMNSPAQNYSVARIVGEKRHPVTWYSVPAYTDEVMAHANERASILLKYRGGIDKDSILYELGAREANRICDTGYPKSPWRREIEQALFEVITAHLGERGYASLPGVLEAVQRRTGHDRERIMYAWKSYRHQLANEVNIRYGRPSARQKVAYCLHDNRWIITRDTAL